MTERQKVLEMLAKNIISAEEAEKILESLEQNKDQKNKTHHTAKNIKVIVQSKKKNELTIEVPIAFSKILKYRKSADKLESQGVDIDEVLKRVQQGEVGELVNIKSEDGSFVKIIVE